MTTDPKAIEKRLIALLELAECCVREFCVLRRLHGDQVMTPDVYTAMADFECELPREIGESS